MQVLEPRLLRRLIVSPHDGITERLNEIFSHTGTLLEGHFELDSQRHTPYFIRFSQIGWKPDLVAEVADMLIAVAPFVRESATIVCAETSAIFLARALGRATGNPVAVAAIDTLRRPTSILRTGHLDEKRPIIVVSDVISTGRSLAPLLKLRDDPAQVLGIAAFAVLSTARFGQFARSHDVEAEWLASSTWEPHHPHPEDCTGCASGTPLLHASEFS